MLMIRSADRLIFAVALVVLLAGILAIYFLSFSFAFTFDDRHSLEGLSSIQNSSTALLYILGGDTGPLGRPLALLSFLLNWASWPDAPTDFRYVNTLIHLLNTLLVLGLTLRLTSLCVHLPSASNNNNRHNHWFALMVAGLWAVLPLLASSTLFIVQRMTTLSATFVLVGLWLYVAGRGQFARSPRAGLTLMTVGIGLGTVLAMLTKENGILLSLYALVLEITLLREVPKPSGRLTRSLATALVVAPAVILFAYLLFNLDNFAAAYGRRHFTMEQRIYTELVILWDYLRQAFLPKAATLGPFQDGYPVYQSLREPAVLVSLLSWIAVMGYAIVWRRRFPVFAFAVFWFLAGHCLESTVISLELYFEHRNYLPLIGPVLALTYGFWHLIRWNRWLGTAVFTGYIALQVVVLWQVCSLWSNPLLAAELWATHNPESSRAAQFLANQYFSSGEKAAARRVILEAATRNPEYSDLQMQSLLLSCGQESDQAFKERLARTLSHFLEKQRYSSATVYALNELVTLQVTGKCWQLTLQNLHEVTDALLANPAFSGNFDARHHLHHIKARLYTESGLLNPTLFHLEKAFIAKPNMGTALLIAATLHSAGLDAEVIEFLDNKAMQYAPKNPLLRNQWREHFEPLRRLIKNSMNN